MKVSSVELEGLKVVELDVWKDSRGFFLERFHVEKFKAAGLSVDFVQDNHSRSLPGVLRGLHYQLEPAQSKLVGVLRGRIWDVAVDIRSGSKTFGKSFGVELSDENAKLLWIPAGFAHGFCVLGDEPADVFYKVNGLYNAKTESGFRWNDPEVAIQWPIQNPAISARDLELPSFSSCKKF